MLLLAKTRKKTFSYKKNQNNNIHFVGAYSCTDWHQQSITHQCFLHNKIWQSARVEVPVQLEPLFGKRLCGWKSELAAGANLKWKCVCFSSDEYNLFAESPANACIGQCLFIRKPNNYSKQIKIRQLCHFITLQNGQKFRLFYLFIFFFTFVSNATIGWTTGKIYINMGEGHCICNEF